MRYLVLDREINSFNYHVLLHIMYKLMFSLYHIYVFL